jgi:hypothetical protein
MTVQTLAKKVSLLEKKIISLEMPSSVLVKLFVDEEVIDKAKKAVFDFDIDKFVSAKDLNLWSKKK